MCLLVATSEKPFSGVSATGREKLELIGVRGQNIEIFIKNIMFQDLVPFREIDLGEASEPFRVSSASLPS